MKVTGQIIRILDNRTVIVNKGREDGITDDTVFRILGDPEEIIDPISHQKLGAVTVVKSRLKAQRVYDKFTIARTSWTESVIDWGGLAGGSARGLFSGLSKTQLVDEGELRVNPDEVQPWKAQSEVPVSVGDTVDAEISAPAAVNAEQPEPEQVSEDAEEGAAV